MEISSSYYDFQSGFRTIASLLYGGSITDSNISLDEFIEKFCSQLTFERLCDILSPAFALNLDDIDTRISKVQNNFNVFVVNVLGDSNLWGAVTFVSGLKDTLADLLWRVVGSTVEDCILNGTGSLQSLANLILMAEKGGIAQAHYPEITLAWMMSQDYKYNNDLQAQAPRSYRVIHINCPVNINVYKTGTGELVASIIDDESQDISESSICAYINIDNEKIVVLPADDSYTVSITAKDDCTVNYSIDEYDLDSMSYTRLSITMRCRLKKATH